MSEKQKSRGALGAVWHYFWKLISGIRLVLSNGVFLVFLFILVGSFMESQPKPLPHNAPLYIAPQGVLVDQLSYSSPGLEVLTGDPQRVSETKVGELIKVIEAASSDAQVSAIVLQLDYLRGGCLSKVAELGKALQLFKRTGKPIIAYADDYSQLQ